MLQPGIIHGITLDLRKVTYGDMLHLYTGIKQASVQCLSVRDKWSCQKPWVMAVEEVAIHPTGFWKLLFQHCSWCSLACLWKCSCNKYVLFAPLVRLPSLQPITSPFHLSLPSTALWQFTALCSFNINTILITTPC